MEELVQLIGSTIEVQLVFTKGILSDLELTTSISS